MGVELSILGIRYINEEEIKELTGKTRVEIEKSQYFRKFFPNAPMDSWYWAFTVSEWLADSNDNIMEMFSFVEAEDEVLYVTWVEELANYRHRDPYDRERIERLLEDVGKVDWDEEFHVVPWGVISNYTHLKPSVMDTEEELVGFIYG